MNPRSSLVQEEVREAAVETSHSAAPAVRRPPLIARVLLWPLLAIVLIHSLIIGLWVAPSTAFRDAVGTDRIREYVHPWFEQNWSLFAPTPRRGDVMFEVRAYIVDPETGEGEETEWAMLTDIEDTLVRGNLTPPRTMKLTRRTSDNLNGARAAMNEDQRQLLEANFFETPIEELRSMLLDVEDGDVGAVTRYMRADETATLISNAYAELTWGDDGDIVRVQYRSSSRRVPVYDPESDLTVDDADLIMRNYGWRPAVEVSPEELDLFSHYATTEVN